MDLTGKTVLVVGSGISGVAATELLKKKNVNVVLFDGNKELDLTALREKHPVFADVKIILGELTAEDRSGLDLVVLSPGVPTDLPMVEDLKKDGIPIWGEIELACHFAKGRIVAITGTNGKTTTTALCGEIMANYYRDVKVVGNIGIPYTSVAADTTDETVTVAEISSFQLETITDFKPDVSAILNITPDHLNRHKTMDCYIDVKKGIAKNQTKEDACILNYDDPVLRRFGETVTPRVIYFSSRELLSEGICLDGDMIVRNHDGVRMEIINIHDMNLLGRHNHENVMAAAAITMELGVPLETIQSVIRDFKAVEHRIEFVAEKAGVKYYNDSKGTNPDAAIQAVNAMPGPTILIAGGYDKNSEYDEWIRSFGKKVRYMVLLGQTREKIAECAARHGFTNVMYAEDMQEAVRVCASYANAGEYVLLSPACASWGMFNNYEERGDVFKECVHSL